MWHSPLPWSCQPILTARAISKPPPSFVVIRSVQSARGKRSRGRLTAKPVTAAIEGFEKRPNASVRSLRNCRLCASAVEIWTSSFRSIPASLVQFPLQNLTNMQASQRKLTAEGTSWAACHNQCPDLPFFVEMIQGRHNGIDHGLREGIALLRPVKLQNRNPIRIDQHFDKVSR